MSTFDNFNKYRVSFVFSTKDRLENIEKVLLTLKNFITESDELVVINGGNTCFLNKLNKYKFQHLKYIHEKDFSDVHAWNKGFLLAEGLIIRIICDDDEYHIKNHEHAFSLLQKNKDLDFIFCGGVKKNTLNNVQSLINLPKNYNYGNSVKDIALFTASGTGHVFKRSVFSKVGLWESPVPDLSFLLKCIINKNVNVKFLSLNCFTHYFNSSSISHKNEKIKEKFILKTVFKYCKFHHFIFFYLRRNRLIKFIYKILLLKKFYKFNNNKDFSGNLL